MKLKLVIVLLLSLLTGCASGVGLMPDPVALDAPDVEVHGNVLIWDSIQNASGYAVEVNGKNVAAGISCRFDLGEYGGNGTYDVRVRAEGDGKMYLTSSWSNPFTVNVERWSPELTVPTGFEAMPAHPRLFLRKYEEQALKDVFDRSGNEYLKKIHSYIVVFAENLIAKDPVISRGWNSSMLNVGREALRRIFFMSYLYCVTGDSRYAERGRLELLSLASFEDWNPSHYLDVAEATLACAAGLDWLHAYLSDDDRKVIAEGMYEKSLRDALNYRYYRSVNNWGPVCVGGMVCGAIAAYEFYPRECRAIIERDVVENRRAMEYYGPDGGYPEGYTYWGYGTSFQTMLISALESAFNYKSEARYATGFMQSARYRQFMSTPTHHVFAYADSSPDQVCCATGFWFAKELKDKTLLWETRRMIENSALSFTGEDRFLPMMLVWASKSEISGAYVPSDNFYVSRGEQPVFVYREGWSSKNDTYLGVKGGYARFSHAHMDSGSFVFEREGVRWSVDLGTQSYGAVQNMIDDNSQNGQRWKVFRFGCDSHSVLRFGEGNHVIDGKALIADIWKESGRKGCKLDMTETFAPYAESVERSVWCDSDDDLHVEDYISDVKGDCILIWNMITEADVEKDSDNTLLLTGKDGVRMKLSCNLPCVPYVVSATTGNSYDPANTGFTRLGFKINIEAGNDYGLEVTLKRQNN